MAQRRSAEEIAQLVTQYRASGMTQAAFCKQTGTVLSSLGRYLRRCSSPDQRLVRVNVASSPAPGPGFVLVLSNGRRIESGWVFGDAEMGRLIRVAESA